MIIMPIVQAVLRWASVWLVLVAVAFLINYPGRLTSDSYDMLIQARYPTYLNDWHAPTVTWLWSLFQAFMPQPQAALLAQSLLIFATPARWLLDHSKPRGILLLITTALCGMSGLLVKDMVLIGALLCCLGVIEYASGYRRIIFTLPFALLALLVRPTNFLLLAAAGTALAWVNSHERLPVREMLCCLLLSIVAVVIPPAVNRIAFDARESSVEKSLIIFDVAGISRFSHKDLFAELDGWPRGLAAVDECYTSRQWDSFEWGPCKQYGSLFTSEMGELGKLALLTWWLQNIATHPIAYIAHRLSYSWILIAHPIPAAENVFPWAANTPGVDKSAITTYGVDTSSLFAEYSPHWSFAPFALMERIVFNRFTCALALLVSGAALLCSLRSRKGSDIMTICSALALGNFLMLMFFGVASEGRYMLPTTLCGWLVVGEVFRKPFLSKSPLKDVRSDPKM
jgi:hypothetical protein